MVLRPRRDRRGHRFVEWQVGLFFLSAGIWLGAVLIGRPAITGAAVVLLFAALLLGVIGRRLDRAPEEEDSVDPVEGGPPDRDA